MDQPSDRRTFQDNDNSNNNDNDNNNDNNDDGNTDGGIGDDQNNDDNENNRFEKKYFGFVNNNINNIKNKQIFTRS